MDLRKLSVTLVVITMVSIGFGNIISDSAEAAFVESLSNNGLPATFIAYDTAWNEAGTMAVVVGYDTMGTGTNAYAYWPANDTYTPIDNDGYNNQRLQAIDYFSQPIYDWPNVLLVDADLSNDDLLNFYTTVFNQLNVYVDTWRVWSYGDPSYIVQDKPTAADMADYDLVVWICTRYMDGLYGAGDALNSNDISEISTYLDNGGNFFLSNAVVSDYFSFGPGTFPYNYLGLDWVNNYGSEYERYVRPYFGDAVFGDMPQFYQDWWNYGWSGYPWVTDTFVSSSGTICLQGQDSMSIWSDTSIRYDSGTFKSMFLGFPLETLYPEDATVLMQAALDWFCPAPPVGLDQSNENVGSSQFIEVGNGMYTDNPWAQAFVPGDDWISRVEFYMYQDSDMGETFEINIYNDAGGLPDYMGTVLTYGTIYSGDIPVGEPNADWVECSLGGGGASLTPGNTYWIVCYRPNFWGNQYWLVDNLLSYTDGNAMDYNGAGWDLLSFDFLFRTYSNIPLGSVDQSNEDNGNTVEKYVCGDPAWAQSFIPSADTVEGVEFYMYRTETGRTDYFEIEICTDNAGEPDMGLGYWYIYQDDIPLGVDNADWVRCVLDTPVSVTPGNTYWIKVTIQTPSYGQYWFIDQAMSYANGEARRYDGMSWNYENYYDWMFRVYSSLSGGGSAGGSLATFYPSKDNTIYSDDSMGSNGKGQYIVSGTDWGGSNYRRGLVEFDISDYIPRYSTITSVSLKMYCDYELSASFYTVGLGFLTGEWGEAGSDAVYPEDYSDMAQTGDATWDYAQYSSDSWGSLGGDYSHTSAYSSAIINSWTTWSESSMVDDVQAWVNDPTTNHGWLLIGDEGMMGSMKSFLSKDSSDPTYWPQLTITYSEPTITGYQDVFWTAGDSGGAPPGKVYKIVPFNDLSLVTMAHSGYPDFYSLAVDDLGNVLCGGSGEMAMYYYDGTGWMMIDSPTDLSFFVFTGIDFNPNDRRFYASGPDFLFYSDQVPLVGGGTSHVYQFNYFPDYSGSLDSDLAWNELYDYGLFGGDTYLIKVWPYGEYANGTVRYDEIYTDIQCHFYDISWDTDEWNEAGITGSTSGTRAYWRYYNSNPQLMEGYIGGAGSYYTCAFKPPSSPKWMFIPLAGGSIRINIEAKDESGEITVSADQPHIFTVDIWKQVDFAKGSLLNTQVDVDSTYTFFIEGNYTIGGIDHWNDLEIDLTAWYDGGNVGPASIPGDPTWALNNYRTRQFNISYDPNTGTDTMLYPGISGASPEFEIQEVWQDPVNYGSDSSWYRLYINVTFGAQTYAADSDFAQGASADPYDIGNALLDADSWDFSVTAFNTLATSARNVSYEEFGIKSYASISVSGNPGGSAPPGSLSYALSTPSQISYSTNTQYFVNVSVPNLLKDGTGPLFIGADKVEVQNTHSEALGNSQISGQTSFLGANSPLCVWGTSAPSTPIAPAFNGTETAGPEYSDFTADFFTLPFEVTEVYWWVTIPASTEEGTYRATITITLWVS